MQNSDALDGLDIIFVLFWFIKSSYCNKIGIFFKYLGLVHHSRDIIFSTGTAYAEKLVKLMLLQ